MVALFCEPFAGPPAPSVGTVTGDGMLNLNVGLINFGLIN
jgi:hypothetical protein